MIKFLVEHFKENKKFKILFIIFIMGVLIMSFSKGMVKLVTFKLEEFDKQLEQAKEIEVIDNSIQEEVLEEVEIDAKIEFNFGTVAVIGHTNLPTGTNLQLTFYRYLCKEECDKLGYDYEDGRIKIYSQNFDVIVDQDGMFYSGSMSIGKDEEYFAGEKYLDISTYSKHQTEDIQQYLPENLEFEKIITFNLPQEVIDDKLQFRVLKKYENHEN